MADLRGCPSEHDNLERVEPDDMSCQASELPLVMQSSNLPTEDGLDIGHDGGGDRTSDCDPDNPTPNHISHDHDYFLSAEVDSGHAVINAGTSVEHNPGDEEPPSKRLKLDSNALDGAVTCQAEKSAAEGEFLFQLHSENSNEADLKESQILDVPANMELDTMEFDILDDANSNDNDDDDDDGSSGTDSSDISLDELDALLEAGLENSEYSTKYAAEQPPGETGNTPELQHEEKQKVILKVRGRDHFDVLPEGWIEVTHNSGMPIYLHKASRVCSVSKPYFLGPGSTRKHEIPISAIPCFHYFKELEKEKNRKDQDENIGSDNLPSAKLESVKDTKESGSLSYMDVREYCMKRFEFQTITVKRFKTWCGRRMHQKQLRQKQRPSLPDNTKLITCPLPVISDNNSATNSSTKKEFIMNPSGKSPVCILHEYVQHTLRVQPRYVFKELENASTPYGAVVMINDMEYGYGYGSSKKQAKSQAAKAALDVLIPKMKIFAENDEQQDVAFFDEVRVEDPRVSELSVKAGQPYPYQILLECLKRNYGMGDTEVFLSMRNLKHQKNEFRMRVGKHTVSVICKNKRDGKHRASQAILQLLHPHISSWGSLLRMYGKGSCKTLKEKKEEEQRITELQSQACANKPNMSILNKLKEEMLKYREKMKMKKPIGKLIPEQIIFSTSDSDLKNVEL